MCRRRFTSLPPHESVSLTDKDFRGIFRWGSGGGTSGDVGLDMANGWPPPFFLEPETFEG